MATCLLWSGLTVIMAAPVILKIFGLNPDSNALQAIGAGAMALGAVLLWLKK